MGRLFFLKFISLGGCIMKNLKLVLMLFLTLGSVQIFNVMQAAEIADETRTMTIDYAKELLQVVQTGVATLQDELTRTPYSLARVQQQQTHMQQIFIQTFSRITKIPGEEIGDRTANKLREFIQVLFDDEEMAKVTRENYELRITLLFVCQQLSWSRFIGRLGSSPMTLFQSEVKKAKAETEAGSQPQHQADAPGAVLANGPISPSNAHALQQVVIDGIETLKVELAKIPYDSEKIRQLHNKIGETFIQTFSRITGIPEGEINHKVADKFREFIQVLTNKETDEVARENGVIETALQNACKQLATGYISSRCPSDDEVGRLVQQKKQEALRAEISAAQAAKLLIEKEEAASRMYHEKEEAGLRKQTEAIEQREKAAKLKAEEADKKRKLEELEAEATENQPAATVAAPSPAENRPAAVVVTEASPDGGGRNERSTKRRKPNTDK
jgi:hypothetical protein